VIPACLSRYHIHRFHFSEVSYHPYSSMVSTRVWLSQSIRRISLWGLWFTAGRNGATVNGGSGPTTLYHHNGSRYSLGLGRGGASDSKMNGLHGPKHKRGYMDRKLACNASVLGLRASCPAHNVSQVCSSDVVDLLSSFQSV
jgi:hypothetical protein